jgi:hypothetical protein
MNQGALGFPMGVMGAGVLVSLTQQVASNSPSLIFRDVISSLYDEYDIEMFNLVPQTSSSLYVKVSIDGGSSWLAGTTYRCASFFRNSNGAFGNAASSNGAAQWPINNGALNSASGGGHCGKYRLYSPANAGGVATCQFHGEGYSLSTDSGHDYGWEIHGRQTTTSPIDALQIIFSSGNIVSGIVRIYGVAKP